VKQKRLDKVQTHKCLARPWVPDLVRTLLLHVVDEQSAELATQARSFGPCLL